MADHEIENLWATVSQQFYLKGRSLHGPDHWRRVERNGLLLSTRTQANTLVVQLFALFHDCRRENEDWDPEHGARGADYAANLRGAVYHLPDDDFERLRYACVHHTEAHSHSDATIGTCWDADRLDLGRVGIIPSQDFMSTEFGREIANAGSIQPYMHAAAIVDPRLSKPFTKQNFSPS